MGRIECEVPPRAIVSAGAIVPFNAAAGQGKGNAVEGQCCIAPREFAARKVTTGRRVQTDRQIAARQCQRVDIPAYRKRPRALFVRDESASFPDRSHGVGQPQVTLRGRIEPRVQQRGRRERHERRQEQQSERKQRRRQVLIVVFAVAVSARV